MTENSSTSRSFPMVWVIIAAVGWIAAAALFWQMNTQRTELAELQAAQGTLTEVQSKVTAAQEEVKKLETTRGEATAIADTQKKLEEAKKAASDAAQQVEAGKRELADLQAQIARAREEAQKPAAQ
jgi:peptidoglycan hydrolase CwlO-like protein